MFDQDGDGAITLEEIKRVLGNDLLKKNPEEWNALLKKYDENNDQKI